jgi:hypothetical protein
LLDVQRKSEKAIELANKPNKAGFIGYPKVWGI